MNPDRDHYVMSEIGKQVEEEIKKAEKLLPLFLDYLKGNIQILNKEIRENIIKKNYTKANNLYPLYERLKNMKFNKNQIEILKKILNSKNTKNSSLDQDIEYITNTINKNEIILILEYFNILFKFNYNLNLLENELFDKRYVDETILSKIAKEDNQYDIKNKRESLINFIENFKIDLNENLNLTPSVKKEVFEQINNFDKSDLNKYLSNFTQNLTSYLINNNNINNDKIENNSVQNLIILLKEIYNEINSQQNLNGIKNVLINLILKNKELNKALEQQKEITEYILKQEQQTSPNSSLSQ